MAAQADLVARPSPATCAGRRTRCPGMAPSSRCGWRLARGRLTQPPCANGVRGSPITAIGLFKMAVTFGSLPWHVRQVRVPASAAGDMEAAQAAAVAPTLEPRPASAPSRTAASAQVSASCRCLSCLPCGVHWPGGCDSHGTGIRREPMPQRARVAAARGEIGGGYGAGNVVPGTAGSRDRPMRGSAGGRDSDNDSLRGHLGDCDFQAAARRVAPYLRHHASAGPPAERCHPLPSHVRLVAPGLPNCYNTRGTVGSAPHLFLTRFQQFHPRQPPRASVRVHIDTVAEISQRLHHPAA